MEEAVEDSYANNTPERIYIELGNFTSNKYRFSSVPKKGQQKILFREKVESIKKFETSSEDEVVDLISKWRIRKKMNESNIDHLEKEKQSKTLKEDNVALEEVIEIIKEYRTEKINYVSLQDLANNKEIINKMEEVKDIFYNMFNRKKIISLAEQNEILLEYIMLNNDFTKRLKDENRYQDNKEIGNKKPILELLFPPSRKLWLIEDNNSTSKIKDEDENEEEETEGKEITETEKASSNSGKKNKKNKRKKKKKQK
ncbi:hypothetical protein RhiirA4_484082 [Rhizophagus irregularis]|uniref:Uncharacterized protein n=1 Tax=Rhizophagus irregularis TaxID=588596 RepID=A0A2I1HNE6_9GLOM|nr:hypothetical protein RhiirA4_484082 [Rhizophagus irregularis]